MKITAVETICVSRGVTVHQGPIQWLWVRIHTDAGLVGLGETYPWPEAEAAIIRRALAPVLLGRDASRIDELWAGMFRAINYSGWAGAEIRAISAIDMALWDLAGKAAGLPVYKLLGGASRDRIRTYNTCYDHLRRRKRKQADPLPESHDPVDRTANDEYHAIEMRPDIEAALADLSPEFRAAVVLVDLQGMSLDQAADTLDVPTGTVKSRLFRARRQLSERLGNLTPDSEHPTGDDGAR